MNILLDTNIVLDLMLERDPRARRGRGDRGGGRPPASPISWMCLGDHQIFFISRKLVGADNATRVVRKCLDVFRSRA